jgi:RecB family exonuclease
LNITPRSTRLVRTADLQAFRARILASIPQGADAVRDCVVIVPTRTAAEQLLQGHTALVTRDEFYARLRERLPGAPPPATPFDREVRLRRAADIARANGAEPPFNPRPGLIREILALYDELRRRHRTVADFDRLLIGTLEPSADHDRGAARLLEQTRFLSATFQVFEHANASASAEGVDEHQVRALALASAAPLFRHVVVTVADQAADPHGLWSADFDLLARLPFLESIDVVATEAVLAAGFHQRLHERELPGIEEVRDDRAAAPLPILVVPHKSESRAFVCRDREEELVEFVRDVKRRDRPGPLERLAVVFQRPLPYLYLARQVFGDGGMAYQAFDSVPLAAEPFAAAVDLIFAALAADFTRGALIELLRSPHFRFDAGGRPLTSEDVHAFDRQLVRRKFLGSVDRLSAFAAADGSSRFLECARAAAAAAGELAASASASDAPSQIDGILGFIRAHEVLPTPSDDWYERHMRARAAVLGALDTLRAAHAANDPSPLSIAELSGAVRRWIEGQTFSPKTGDRGVILVDATSAAYVDVDEVRLVGLTEADWPQRGVRSIFYPASLLAQLGWPSEQDRLAASRARFHDLLRLPRHRVALSTVTLEDDGLVAPSPLLEEVDAAGMPVERRATGSSGSAVFTHEALMLDPLIATAVGGPAADWLALRASRRFDEPRFRGGTGARAPAPYAVSRLERYLECPFKYFAAHVLHLEEERDEEAWLTPQERGQFVHEVFEEFFDAWQHAGHGAITTANVSEAMAMFDGVADRHLERLPETDRALERTLLLGSAAAAGLGERAFAFELEDESPVIERLLEFELRGTFAFSADGVRRDVDVRSKSDRIDLLSDGTLRIIDYKLGRAPDRRKALQLPIYGVCAQQAVEGRHGRRWTLAHAAYVAFKEKQPYVELQPLDKALEEGQARLVATVEAIERGEFPVEPEDPFRCTWCGFAGVCRKDYVGDE